MKSFKVIFTTISVILLLHNLRNSAQSIFNEQKSLINNNDKNYHFCLLKC